MMQVCGFDLRPCRTDTSVPSVMVRLCVCVCVCCGSGTVKGTLLFGVTKWASWVALLVKNPPANAGDLRDMGLIPGSGRSPGEGNGNPPQYSCLENTMDRGAWWARVHGVAKSQTRLKRLSTHKYL